MSFVDQDMNEQLTARMNPVSRDDGSMAPPGDIAAQRYPDAPPEWTAGGLVAASFRQNNTLGSIAYLPAMGTWDPNWKPPIDELPDDLKVHAPWLATSRNQNEWFSMIQGIEKEKADRREIAAAPGWASFGVGLATTIFDPTVLLPQAGAIKRIGGGYSIAKSAVAMGLTGGAGVAAQEALLHSMQAERTGSESAINIGAGIVLGGLLGGGAAGFLNRAGAVAGRKATRALDGIMENAPDETPAVSVLSGEAQAAPVNTRGSGRIFHGSDARVEAPHGDASGDHVIYGKGFYTTDATDIAEGYAKARGKGAGAVTEYEEINAPKMLDGEAKLPEDILSRLEANPEFMPKLTDLIAEKLGKDFPWPEDGMKGWVNLLRQSGASTREVLDAIRKKMGPDGVDEFVYTNIRDVRHGGGRADGYDGLTHVGGLLTGEEAHHVRVYFDPTEHIRAVPETSHLPTPTQAVQAATGNAQPASAEAARTASLADLSISGRIAGKLGKWTSFMNPALRATQRMTREARQVMLDMQGGTVYHQINDTLEAATPGGAAATLARSKNLARVSAAEREHQKIYTEMRKSGVSMSQSDFEKKVGLAMGKNDADENPFVARAAQAWRTHVFDPFLKEAQELGLIPHDLDVKGAESYFSRVYDVPLIVAHEAEFKARLIPHMEQVLKNAYDKAVEKLEFRTGLIDYELSMLKASPEERLALLAQNDQILQDLSLRGSAQRQKEILALQSSARELAKAGDTAGAEAARADAKSLMREGDKDFYNYKQAKKAVAQQNRLLKLSASGQEDEANKVLDSLVAIEDKQSATLESLAERAMVNRRKLDRVKPDEEAKFLQEQTEMMQKATGGAWENLLKLQAERDRITEKINAANEVIKKKVDKADTNIAGIKAQQEEAAKLVKSLEPAKRRVEQMMVKQGKIHERLRILDERIRSAGDDFEDARVALNEAYVALIDTTTDRTLMRGAKMERLKEKLKAIGPEVTEREIAKREAKLEALKTNHETKWNPNYEKEPPFSRYAKEIVDDFTNKVTGRNAGEFGDIAEYATPVRKGPLKDRTSYFPDSIFHKPPAGADRGFLDTNVRRVGHRYARIMSAENELTRQFGRADMREQLDQIDRAYQQARDTVDRLTDPKEAWAALGMEGKAPKTIAEIKSQLERDMKGAQEDIRAVRDLIRGNYKVKENQGNFGRIVRGLTAFNYIRSMGGVVISNVTELYRPAMVHGLTPYMGLGLKALTGQLDGIKMSVQEAKLAGLVAESILHHRMSEFAELADPLAHGTAAERMMENAARFANKWSGLSAFTDAEEAIASVMTQNRMINALMQTKTEMVNGQKIVREAAKDEDLRWLAFLNLGTNERRQLRDMLSQHAEKVDGVWVANTDRWTAGLEAKLKTLDPDDPAYGRATAELQSAERVVDAYRAALLKDVNSVIVQRTPGDIALAASTPLGRLLLQFRTYNLAAHQKVMMRGFQESPGALLSGIVGMTSLGVMVSYLQAVRGGKERLEKWKTSAMNPGFLIGEGLDKSGLFPMLFDVNNTADAAFRASGFNFNPLKTPMLKTFPQAAQTGDSSRWNPNNNMFGELLGPTAGLIEDVPMAAGAAWAKANGMEIGARGRGAVNRVIPFGSYLGMKEFLQIMAGDSPYMRK